MEWRPDGIGCSAATKILHTHGWLRLVVLTGSVSMSYTKFMWFVASGPFTMWILVVDASSVVTSAGRRSSMQREGKRNTHQHRGTWWGKTRQRPAANCQSIPVCNHWLLATTPCGGSFHWRDRWIGCTRLLPCRGSTSAQILRSLHSQEWLSVINVSLLTMVL